MAAFAEEYRRFILDIDTSFDEVTESMQDIQRAAVRNYMVAQRITELRSAAQRIDRACTRILEYM
jgi:hypothetical protein